MNWHLLKTSIRFLLHHRLYTSINVLGLALGLASCLLIGLFVRYELSYDSFFTDAEHIYRLSPDYAATSAGPARYPAANVAPLAPLIVANNLSGVESVARLGGMHALISHEQTVGYEDGFRWADPSLFEIFDFQWLAGDQATALSNPDSVVITQAIAQKYFGETDVIGKTLMLENSIQLTVSGVIANLPENTHLFVDLIVPIETAWQIFGFDYRNNWSFTAFHTYLKLVPGTDINAVTRQIEDLAVAANENSSNNFFQISSQTFGLTPYRISDIHMYSNRVREFKDGGSPTFLIGFTAIAISLLLVACFNTTNLSTACALRRTKEIGMRKVLGADENSLRIQFLFESLLMTVLALFVSLAQVEALRPAFSGLLQRDLPSGFLFEPGFMLPAAFLTLVVAVAAGAYPAFYLARQKPAQVFSQKSAKAQGLPRLKDILVMGQFTVAIVLIIATVVVYLQMQYTRNMELGFNRDHVLVLWGTHNDGMGENWEALKQELRQHPNISHVTEADMQPGSVGSRRIRIEGGSQAGIDIQTKEVGFGFLEAYDIELLAGRSFNESIASDTFHPPVNVPAGQPTGTYILNESALQELGLTFDDALGKIIELDFSTDFSLTVNGPIIGIVEDIHVQSLRESIRPLIYFAPAAYWGDQARFNVASVRLQGNNVADTVDFIRQRWSEVIPEIPLAYHFLESEYELLYQDETRQGQLFTLFAALTILIACLGLFGLVSFSIESRRREIGIRKVVGSNAWGILILLSKDFSKLILASNLIAWPLAYYLTAQWLQNFAYRIDLSLLIFIGSGVITLCIAWVTVCSTAIRAATENPVHSLRYE